MLLQSAKENLNTPVINFNLKGTDEHFYSLEDFKDKEILIIIFMCNHCPYVLAVIERFVKFQEKYKDKGVQLVGINPNDVSTYPRDSFENMIKFHAEHKMNFPYLVDETQETATAYGAVCTPDIYLYDANRELKYRGRLDNNWKDETSVTQKDLEIVTAMLLNGENISKLEQVPSMGCSIKWKN
ncbi:MAG: thioredoxin family protein [Ignavibacteria bacterium]|nr:thioredoxin family protein [Ignavibacteria bacterium]